MFSKAIDQPSRKQLRTRIKTTLIKTVKRAKLSTQRELTAKQILKEIQMLKMIFKIMKMKRPSNRNKLQTRELLCTKRSLVNGRKEF
jgi:hypothetical protein